ncbi:hypothetical protein BKA67DRAFT_544927 [Truncatella angustata]|uniref:Uncharacterized protein n=1 Tax=Truncatella angustata TaxID=152316 RepID=A0A9P8UWA7_9PEZI|nr:uncharacterized protein BKA67DRAFT_544927 [Truncatella angustata]KAH6659578.1 hypothetical protein BKA67DRAFT_544927 [Truncatella angustata]KAH8199640.1 hypothetical protein TruAng_006170 [Truncatella angustata]
MTVRVVPPFARLDEDDDYVQWEDIPDEPPRQGMVRRVSSHGGFTTWVDARQVKRHRRPAWMLKRGDRPGRELDHLRTATPVIPKAVGFRPYGGDPYARWRHLIKTAPHIMPDHHHTITLEELNEQPQGAPTDLEQQLSAVQPKRHNWFFVNPLPQLIFRLLVLGSTISSLAMATVLYRTHWWWRSTDSYELAQRSQVILSITVDSLSIPYVFYMTFDDVFRPPLGLRRPIIKVSLTLLDVLFIILKAASTALAFQALETSTPTLNQALVRALAACLFTGLVFWVVNFTISLLRIIERLGGMEKGRKIPSPQKNGKRKGYVVNGKNFVQAIKKRG